MLLSLRSSILGSAYGTTTEVITSNSWIRKIQLSDMPSILLHYLRLNVIRYCLLLVYRCAEGLQVERERENILPASTSSAVQIQGTKERAKR